MPYYDAISEGYDELHGEEQNNKLKIIKKLISPKQNETLLDVGCGTGICTDWNCRCTGIDPSKGLIKEAKKKYKNIKFIVAPAEKIPFKEHSFDYVISVTALHLCQDIDKALDEIKRVGKNNLILTVLKKSSKSEEIINKIKSKFNIKKTIEEERDIILIS
ncbi:class I SAM-dependent methyltransferase [Candidatus Woesearchaeota archaeon]|nr:class I SAM-dependent methyltransferase [Candidatus Woesearchaeota archaeon]